MSEMAPSIEKICGNSMKTSQFSTAFLWCSVYAECCKTHCCISYHSQRCLKSHQYLQGFRVVKEMPCACTKCSTKQWYLKSTQQKIVQLHGKYRWNKEPDYCRSKIFCRRGDDIVYPVSKQVDWLLSRLFKNLKFDQRTKWCRYTKDVH